MLGIVLELGFLLGTRVLELVTRMLGTRIGKEIPYILSFLVNIN